MRHAYNQPMWSSVDELHQIGSLDTVGKTIQKSLNRNKETKNIIGKHLLTWSQTKMYQNH